MNTQTINRRIRRILISRISMITLLGAGALLTVLTTARAATLTVTTAADATVGAPGCSDGCGLREAIAAATAGDTIQFASPLFDSPQTITLSEAAGFRELYIDKDLTVTGKGAHLLTVRRAPDATEKFRVINIESVSHPSVSISGMTITGGDLSGVTGNGTGGGIRVYGAYLTLDGCVITRNSANTGGGIYSQNLNDLTVVASTVSNNTATAIVAGGAGIEKSGGALTITNSTVSGNVKTAGDNYSAGGILSAGAATIITNSTVTDNGTAGSSNAGGVVRTTGTVTIRNSIVAANRNNTATPDVYSAPFQGSISSGGYNIIGNRGTVSAFNQTGDQTGSAAAPLDPRFLPLADNGGATPTHRLQINSPAIDKGKAFGSTTDQRGFTRPIDRPEFLRAPGGDDSDIGAFEADSFTFTVTKTADTKDGACDADCSLRDAIEAAIQYDVIEFASPLFASPQTITLTNALQIEGKNLTVAGRGAHLLTVRRAPDAPPFRIFNIVNATVLLAGMTITGGSSNGDGGGVSASQSILIFERCHIAGNTASGRGGGIRAAGGSELHIASSTVSGNASTDGSSGAGGIYSDNYMALVNSTVSGNRKTSGTNNGGGIWASGGLDIVSSTIADNEASGAGSAGGVFKNGGAGVIRNTLVAANRHNSNVPDAAGAFSSYGHNLVGNVGAVTGFNNVGDQKGNSAAPLDPLLLPLALAGGTTPTHAFASSSSPAIDKGAEPNYAVDQRGLLRPFDDPLIANASGVNADGADIGAFEAQAIPTAAAVSISGRVLAPGGGLRNARVTLTDARGNSQTNLTGAGGAFRFADVPAGETYVISIASRRYVFAPQALFVGEDLDNLIFTAAGAPPEIILQP